MKQQPVLIQSTTIERTTPMRLFATAVFLLCLAVPALAEIKGEEVQYTAEGVTMKGYLAYDPSVDGKRPGVLVVHEWWGHNEYARKRARMLAELGYTALAVDMYGDGKQAAHPDDAGKFATEMFQNMPVAKARFLAALELLKKHETVDASNIGAIGYCFGGGIVLAMARMGVDLKGVVSFHGSLATQNRAKAGDVKAAVLVCTGAADPFISKEDVQNVKKEMKDAKVNFTFKSYPGAKHSFTNPDATETGKKFNLPLEYNAKADKESWNEMKAFFKRVFASK
jgi:dienelactone hydrolase